MSVSTALDYTYVYAYASGVERQRHGTTLNLATCSANQEHPHFFEGRLRCPRVVADILLALTEVVRTHFFLPRPAVLDPVVTSNEAMLRFEGFSGCCGVYARADLPDAMFESNIRGRGTTNVDFNEPMRVALTCLRDDETVELAVGRQGIELTRSAQTIVEKKVKLPVRWIKGFSEVQAYQPRLKPRFEIPASEARRFLRTLPRGTTAQACFIVACGRGVRLSQREEHGAVRLLGTHRLRVLEHLLPRALALRVWEDANAGTSAWEVVFERARFFLMLSPEVQRGFSGEGQVLKDLALVDWQTVIGRVRAQLKWQAQIDVQTLAQTIGLMPDQVRAALAALGARGLAGYDADSGCYFHRELPFDLERVEKLQPRLLDARRLLAEGKVALLQESPSDHGDWDVEVGGTGVSHYVRLRSAGDRCTCPWFSRYQGERGPCKHILAARLRIEQIPTTPR